MAKPSPQPAAPEKREFVSRLGALFSDSAYTDLPWKLLVFDVYLFLKHAWTIPFIFWPITPTKSGELGELHPTWDNFHSIAIQLMLGILQVLALASLPWLMLLPVWMAIVVLAGFLVINKALCNLVNDDQVEYRSDPKYAPALPEHAHEQWIYINGVTAGSHWMQTNVNRLAATFKRPILGIHNKTSGLLLDILECLIQRNLGYATCDVRVCYRIIKSKLHDPRYSKVIFLLHSQGGVQGSLVLDWLLQELPQDLLAKMEIYTFGNASSHFNNPLRFTRNCRTRVPAQTIPHIEHYTHAYDFVARWGALHFATSRTPTSSPNPAAMSPRFAGRVFLRKGRDGNGHLLVQHYLDGMFPVRKRAVRDENTGRVMEEWEVTDGEGENPFMESEVAICDGVNGIDKEGDDEWNKKEGFAFGEDVEVYGLETRDCFGKEEGQGKIKVKELSRLWQYRNGRCPREVSSGLVRTSTV